MGHTPGPWEEIDGEIYAGSYFNGGPSICEITSDNPDDKSLVKSAPDLLEAAREVYEWMNDLPIPTAGCTTKMQLLYNAISKATLKDR